MIATVDRHNLDLDRNCLMFCVLMFVNLFQEVQANQTPLEMVCSVCFESSQTGTVEGWYTCKWCKESVCYGCLRSVLMVSTSESKKLECVQPGCFKRVHKKLAIELVGRERVVRVFLSFE